jgi:hypothetical protein
MEYIARLAGYSHRVASAYVLPLQLAWESDVICNVLGAISL